MWGPEHLDSSGSIGSSNIRPMPAGPIEAVTAGVRDLADALAFFRDRLRLETVADARASVGLLGAWRRPVHESVRLVELRTPGSGGARLRLAEYENGATAAGPSRSGPRALVLAAARNASLDGPDGLAIALRRDPHVSVILAADDLDAANRFHTEALGWSSLESGGVELVEAPRDETLLAPGHLGITHLTCACDDLDDTLTRVEAMGIEPVTRPTHVGLPGGRPGRVMLVRAPGNALYEIFELAA